MKNEIHLVEEEEEEEAGKIACIGDKKVETREETGRGVCRREKEGEREKESGFFLRVRRGCTSGCWPDSRTFQDVRPFLFQALLSLALLLFASCAAEAADTSKPSVSVVAVAAPETPSIPSTDPKENISFLDVSILGFRSYGIEIAKMYCESDWLSAF